MPDIRFTSTLRGLRFLHKIVNGIIIIINGILECKEYTIHTQTQVVASRKPKKIKRTHEGEANFTT